MSANQRTIFRIKHSKRIENYTTFYILRNNAEKGFKKPLLYAMKPFCFYEIGTFECTIRTLKS